MTWREFKAAMTAAGVTDDTEIGVIDYGDQTQKLDIQFDDRAAVMVYGDWSVGSFKREP